MDLYTKVLMIFIVFTAITSFACSRIVDTIGNLTVLSKTNKLKYNLIVFSPTVCCCIIIVYLIFGLFYYSWN